MTTSIGRGFSRCIKGNWYKAGVLMLVKKQVLKKIPQPNVTEILKRYQQDKSLRELINPGMTPVDLINLMEREKRYNELVIFLCHSLQATEAVWWGYLCIRQKANDLPGIQKKALAVVDRWLHEPVETYRRMAEVAAKQVELDNACG